MPLASDIQLPERYRVTRHIATGGMASVWEVEDLVLGRSVAVKVLGGQYAADRSARARFAREARTAARVCDHPHIATIYDIGEHGEDAFIVMELFSGGTVADRLRAARDGGRRVPRETVLRWLREAAGGLDSAHAAGVVHRDVKPANLLLDGQERLAVGDFGIARLADDTHMTQTGQVLGTAAYLSPEQALGRPATVASDRYALAVVAFELLTGTRPYAGGPPTAQARQHAEARPAAASEADPDLPRAVDGVFDRGLAKDPLQRPRTAAELVGQIERALRDPAPAETTRPLAPVAPVPAAAPAPEPPVPAPEPPAPAPAPAPVSAPEPLRGRPREPAPAASAPSSPAASTPSSPAAPTPSPRAAVTPTPPAGGSSPPPSPPDDDAARPPSQPAAPAGGPARRPLPVPPLVPIGLAAAVAGAILALVLVGGGDESQRKAASTAPRTTQQRERAEARTTANPAPRATAAQPTQTAPPPVAAASAEDPAALNDRGYALSQRGDYAGAVPLLRRSVEGYRRANRTNELGYAYALFNLGVALTNTGDLDTAIDVLRERLEYPDQRSKVQRALREAQAQSGGDAEEQGRR